MLRRTLLFVALMLVPTTPAVGRPSDPVDAGLFDISFSDARRGWAVGAIDTLLRTTDGGRHWRRQKLGVVPQGNRYLSVQATGTRTGWMVGELGVYKTADGGRRWTRTAKKLSPDPIYGGIWSSLTFATARRGWVQSGSGDVIRTANAGRTWSRQRTSDPTTQDAAGRIVAISSRKALMPMNAVGGHYLAGIGVHGRTWSTLSPVPFWSWNPDIVGVAATNPNTFWLAARTGEVFLSIDAGATWQALQPTTEPLIASGIWSAGTTVILSGAVDGVPRVLFSTGGGGWASAALPAGVGAPVRAMSFVSASKGFGLTGSGQVLRTDDAGRSWRFARG